VLDMCTCECHDGFGGAHPNESCQCKRSDVRQPSDRTMSPTGRLQRGLPPASQPIKPERGWPFYD
jgi:hypothetical protein